MGSAEGLIALRRLGVACLLALAATAHAEPAKPVIEIYMPSPCLACIDWGAYLAD